MPEIIDNKKRRIFLGIVVNNKMDKTIVVKVDNVKSNTKYKKQYVTSKKYKVHDEANKYKIDDKVKFTECRPISKDKRWKVL